MENAKTKILSREGDKKFSVKTAVQFFFAAVAFLLAGVSFDGDIYPFALAFAGGAPERYLLSVCLGVSAGTLVFSPHISALRYVSSAVLLFFVRTTVKKRFRETYALYACPIVTFLCLITCSLTVSLAFSPDFSTLLLEICDAVIAGACSVFSYRVFQLITSGVIPGSLSSGDTASCILWGTLILTSLGRWEIRGFSPARFAAFFAVMLLSFCCRETAGTITGICTGLVFGLTGAQPQLLLALPLAGLLCGLCAEHGKIAVASAFAAANILSLLLKGDAGTALVAAAEFTAASLLFALLPCRFLDFCADRLLPLARTGIADDCRQQLSAQMEKSAKAVRDMAYSVEAVCRMLSRTDKPDLRSIPADVKDDVCADCMKNRFCWERTSPITEKAFGESLKTLNENGRLTPDTLPERLSIVCREKNAVCDSFNRLYCEHNARLTARSEIFEAKALAAAQLRCTADIMEDATARAVNASPSDDRLTAIAERVFSSFGYEFSSLLVSGAKSGRCVIELLCTSLPKNTDENALLQKLAEKTDISFLRPVRHEHRDGGTLLTLCEKTPLGIRYHKTSRIGDGEKLCGDTCEAFPDGRGNFYCVLSDGMGSGTHAALDSVMTSSLFSKLMRAEFSVDTALSAVNSALSVKSADETLATLDILTINLYDGSACVYKAGGSFSVIWRSGKTGIIEKASMPLGILRETHFETTRLTLKKGDKVLMLSDGAQTLPPEFFKELFDDHRNADPKETCSLVIDAAVKASPSGRIDDITAVCIHII